jgi:hypothetical protein
LHLCSYQEKHIILKGQRQYRFKRLGVDRTAAKPLYNFVYLQIGSFALTPFLYIHRAEVGNAQRHVEEKEYHKGVDVLFNLTA